MEETNSQTHRWHLKKEIQLGHLITTITVAISAVIYVQRMEQRLIVLENEMVHQRARDEQQDKTQVAGALDTQKRLDRIEEKLDRMLERMSKR